MPVLQSHGRGVGEQVSAIREGDAHTAVSRCMYVVSSGVMV